MALERLVLLIVEAQKDNHVDSHTSRLTVALDRGCLRRPHKGCKSDHVATPAEEARKGTFNLSVHGQSHVSFDGSCDKDASRA